MWDDEKGTNAQMDDLSVTSMTTDEESIYCVMSANIHGGALILSYGLYQHPHLTPDTSQMHGSHLDKNKRFKISKKGGQSEDAFNAEF